MPLYGNKAYGNKAAHYAVLALFPFVRGSGDQRIMCPPPFVRGVGVGGGEREDGRLGRVGGMSSEAVTIKTRLRVRDTVEWAEGAGVRRRDGCAGGLVTV